MHIACTADCRNLATDLQNHNTKLCGSLKKECVKFGYAVLDVCCKISAICCIVVLSGAIHHKQYKSPQTIQVINKDHQGILDNIYSKLNHSITLSDSFISKVSITYEHVMRPSTEAPVKRITSCLLSTTLPLSGEAVFHVSRASTIPVSGLWLQARTSAENWKGGHTLQ